MKKALVILNGTVGDEIKEFNLEEYSVFCIDGGTNSAFKRNIMPLYIIGDLDSAEKEIIDYYSSKKVKIISFPVDKNESDFELGLRIVAEQGFKEIAIIGGHGGRLDHCMLNLFLALRYFKMGFNIKFYNNNETLEFVCRDTEIRNCVGKTVSLIAAEECYGVSLKGFKYKLENGNISFGSTLGLSNIVEEEKAEIELAEGILVLIINR